MPLRFVCFLPHTGPFLQTLLSKLESMMSNTLYVNLLLTAVIARLACYPQPLLRSFLLNPSLVFQPTVKSLVQVLETSSVPNQITPHNVQTIQWGVGVLLNQIAVSQLVALLVAGTGFGQAPCRLSLLHHQGVWCVSVRSQALPGLARRCLSCGMPRVQGA